MRLNIVHPGADELRYEIRSIVEFAHSLEREGVDITWENIGDPIAKGEKLPEWMKQIVASTVAEDTVYGYSPTKGLLESRQFIAEKRTEENGAYLDPENIVFFNGLGDAITKVYSWLHPAARVMGPNPAYPTHSSIEGAHGSSEHLTYLLDPDKNWLPDVDDIRNKVKYNPGIAALLIINPDNPTGMIYPKSLLQELVEIAKEYGLFLIADEIYANLAFDQDEFVSIASLADDVPTMIMRGLSKEMPWPGGRCGWLEFYNTDKDPSFARYAKSIVDAKMNEVCSTTLPQAVLPKLMSDKRYESFLQSRRKKYAQRAKTAEKLFAQCPQLHVVRPRGAFYLSVTFTDDFYEEGLQFAIPNRQAAALYDNEVADEPNMPLDKKFCLRLLAATGVCTVPLSSGFNSHVQGFRMTLLEEDEDLYEETIKNIMSVFNHA